MNEYELSQQVLALLNSTGVTVYDDTVPDSPEFPYIFVDMRFPEVAERAQTRHVHSLEIPLRTTVAAANKQSFLMLAARLSVALENTRVTAPGWKPMKFESVSNGQSVERDLDVTLPNSTTHPLYQVFDWLAISSRTS